MSYTFRFPDIGEGLTEGKILEWYVKPGDSVKSGDPLVKMETDKVVTDIPSPKNGVVTARQGEVDEIIDVGSVLVELKLDGDSGKDTLPPADRTPTHDSEVSEPGFGVVGSIAEADDDSSILPESKEGKSDRPFSDVVMPKVLATPVARALARELGVDILAVPGTGPGGRVTKSDIQKWHDHHTTPARVHVQPTPESAESTSPVVETIPMTQIRKAIARRMSESKHNAAHMTVFEEVEATKLVQLRRDQKAYFAERGVKLTYMPFIMKAVALALKDHRALNGSIDMDKGTVTFRYDYNIGIAVDAPDGLVVPVVHHVDKQSIYDLSLQLEDFAERARERTLTLNELKDGTFSITNYGAIAGIYGAPVINYPEVGILGVGRIMETPVVNNGEIVVGHVLPLSLAADHRMVDGATASRFIRQVMDLLAEPERLLLY